MSCQLDFTPFRNKQEALIAKDSIIGAFAVTKISNDRKWWYVVSKDDEGYKIHFKDGIFAVPEEDKRTFDVLYSRLDQGNTVIDDPTAYITPDDLINTFEPPVLVPPTAVTTVIECDIEEQQA